MKKYKDYLIVSGIVLVIFFTIFIFKGIYPFGDYTSAFSDMQAQIIDFYYHFRSSIIGNSSLFIDFNTSWGTDFFSQFVHYVNSPFTLLTEPIKEGYAFNGWTVTGEGSSVSDNILTIGTGDTTITANWSKNTTTTTTKKVLGNDYNMKPSSEVRKEWYEQVILDINILQCYSIRYSLSRRMS